MISPPWADLPALPLHHVATTLSSLADYHSFGRVCRSWSDAASAAKISYMSAHSPLVLCSANEEEEEEGEEKANEEEDDGKRTAAVTSGSRYLYTIYSFCDRRFYSTRLSTPSTTPRSLRCIGFSNGYLITLLDSAKRQPLLLNPLTGHQLVFPESPFAIDTAVLLNMPGGRRVLVSLMSPWCSFQFCEGHPLNTEEAHKNDTQMEHHWSVCGGDARGANAWVWCAAVCKGKAYALAADWQLVELNLQHASSFSAAASFRYVSEDAPPDLVLPTGSASLVEHAGELYAVVPVTPDDQHWADPPKSLQLFKFDFSLKRWLKVTRGLNGASFFVGHLLHAAADANPEKWGGEKDCVYYTHFWRGCRKIYRLRVKTGEVDDVSVVADEPAIGTGLVSVKPEMAPTITKGGGEINSKDNTAAVDWSFCVWVFPWLCYNT